MVASRLLDHVRYKFRSDRGPALVLLVLPSIGEERDNSRYPLRTGNLASMDHYAELHERGVDGSTAGSDDIHIVLSNGFRNLDCRFANGTPGDFCLSKGKPNAGFNEFRDCRWQLGSVGTVVQ